MSETDTHRGKVLGIPVGYRPTWAHWTKGESWTKFNIPWSATNFVHISGGRICRESWGAENHFPFPPTHPPDKKPTPNSATLDSDMTYARKYSPNKMIDSNRKFSTISIRRKRATKHFISSRILTQGSGWGGPSPLVYLDIVT